MVDSETQKALWSFSYFADLAKQQMKLPGFPTAKPSGYKPPELFDPDRDPEGKGYRLGTVRDWAEGPHIKTRLGWLPYDAKNQKVKTEERGWVPLEHVTGKKRIEVRSQYPDASSFKSVKDAIDRYRSPFESEEKRDQAFKHMIGVTERLDRFLKRVEEDASIEDEMESAHFDAKFSSEKAQKIIEQSSGNITDSATDKLAEHLSEALSDTADLTQHLQKHEKRKRRGHFRMEVVQDIGDNPLLKQLAQEPVAMQPLALLDQGYLNFTQIRTLEDGTKTIFKHDAFSLDPSAKNEAASYLLMERLLGSDSIPPSLLTSETPWSEEMIQEAEEKFKMRIQKPGSEEKLGLDDEHLGVVQELVEGSTLASQERELSTDPDALDNLMSIVTFDLLTGNWDRNPGNILLSEDGAPIGIDNGEAFRFETMKPDQYYVHETLEYLLDTARAQDPEALSESTSRIKDRMEKVKRGDLDTVLGDVLEERVIEKVAQRWRKVYEILDDYGNPEEEEAMA